MEGPVPMQLPETQPLSNDPNVHHPADPPPGHEWKPLPLTQATFEEEENVQPRPAEEPLRPRADSGSSSNLAEYVSHNRYWLTTTTVLVFLLIVVGVLFIAHDYFHRFGGQGFLKVQDPPQVISGDTVEIYLPWRQVEVRRDGSGLSKKSPESVPFYTCGDQQHSCEAYGQPNMCCPIETVCHPSPFTFSNVYCCNATSSSASCTVTPGRLPTCPTSTLACTEATGGGCCPTGLICSPNGCLDIKGASIVSPAPSPSSGAGTPTEQSTVTIIESPASTATLAKEAEIAQEVEGSGAKDSVVFTLWNQYFSAWLLVCVAGVMGML